MASAALIPKRIPSIKFPIRRPSLSPGSHATSSTPKVGDPVKAPPPPVNSSDVPSSPRNPGSGGSALLQPRRTPVTQEEIDAVMLGGAP